MSAPLEFARFHARLGRPGRLFVLAPHPDDETCGCGGLLALAAAAGLEVNVALMTDGTGSQRASAGHPPERLAAVRRREMARALRRLAPHARIRPARLGLPDGACERLAPDALASAGRRLERLLRRAEPDLILAPWRRDPHGDHRAGAVLARDAAARAAPGARLAEYDVWTALTGRPDDQPKPDEVETLRLDIRPVLAAKRRALQAHASQLGRRIRDDPDGFSFTAPERRALLRPVEPYFL